MYQQPLAQRLWYKLVRQTIQLGATFLWNIRYSGRQNVPTSGPVLIVSNHQSHLDPPLVGIGSPRHIHCLARDTLFRSRFFGALIRSVNAYPIDREGMGISGIKETLRYLRNGEVVLVFPEGTRTPDGEIGPFKPGFSALAVRSGAAIVPAAIEGAFTVWPRSQKFPGAGRIRIHYGPAMSPEEVRGYNDRELIEEVEKRVRQCQALLRERRDSRRGA